MFWFLRLNEQTPITIRLSQLLKTVFMSELALKLITENKAKHAYGEDARVLDLGNCGLTEVPVEVGELVWLEDLILSNGWWEYNIEKRRGEWKECQNSGMPNRIQSIAGIENLTRLIRLVVAKHRSDIGENWGIQDLSPLSGLSSLKVLTFNRTQVRNLYPLSHLRNLQVLWCYSTQVSDLSPLSKLYPAERGLRKVSIV